jgi:hypothetical protein
LTVP